MNQHYVPKSYLKSFADAKGKEYFVNVYDKLENRFFKTNVKNICSETNLYTLEEGNKIAKDLFAVEKAYSNGIEPLYLKVLDILTNNSIQFITRIERTEILISIFQLYFRNPILLKRSIIHHKNVVNNHYTISKSKGLKGFTYLDEDYSFRDWSLEQILNKVETDLTKVFKEHHLKGIEQIGIFHERAIFDICYINDNSEFLTCDNPLIIEDRIQNNLHPFQKSIEFTIPLNKKFALKMYHDNTKALNQIYRHYHPSGSVEMTNCNIYDQATRFVFTDSNKLKANRDFKSTILDSTALDSKISIIKQIVEKFPIEPHNRDAHVLMRKYLHKYETSGTLTKEDEYTLAYKIKKMGNEEIRKKIG